MIALPGPDQTTDRQVRALAEPTRRRIFETIANADVPVDVATLTTEMRIHHTTVRSHLTCLRDAGLIVEESAPARGPGRPRLRYRTAPHVGKAWRTRDPNRRLGLLLADALMTDRTTNTERTHHEFPQ